VDEWQPLPSRREPHVAFDSSIARMPFPGFVMLVAVSRSSSSYLPARVTKEARFARVFCTRVVRRSAPTRVFCVARAAISRCGGEEKGEVRGENEEEALIRQTR